MAIETSAVVNLLVPGRAHQVLPDGSLGLSLSSVARVVTASEYYKQFAESFAEQEGAIRFEGGWAEAAAGMPMPPKEQREGRLMNNLAAELGIPARYRSEGIHSTTTMANCLEARGQFRDVARLAIVTQVSQADRLLFCAGKVFPRTELTIVEATGETDEAIMADEQRLLKQSRVLYGLAHGPRLLRAADRAGVLMGRLAGLRPAEKYGTAF